MPERGGLSVGVSGRVPLWRPRKRAGEVLPDGVDSFPRKVESAVGQIVPISIERIGTNAAIDLIQTTGRIGIPGQANTFCRADDGRDAGCQKST